MKKNTFLIFSNNANYSCCHLTKNGIAAIKARIGANNEEPFEIVLTTGEVIPQKEGLLTLLDWLG